MSFRNNLARALPGLARGVGGGLGGIGGSYFSNPLDQSGAGARGGQQLGETLFGLAGDLASSYLREPDPREKEMEAAQDELLQQLRQRGQYNFEPIAQREIGRFNTQVLPGIAQRFGTNGSLDSSAFQGAVQSGGNDLRERLAALGAGHQLAAGGLEQSRLGMLGNFLAGQQGLGQGNYEFGQRFGQAGQELGQSYDLRRQQNLQQGLNTGLGQNMQSVYRPGQSGFVSELAQRAPDLWNQYQKYQQYKAGLGQQAGQPAAPTS